MGVYKYTKSLAYAADLEDKVKPEPWLHCAIELQQEGIYLAIYIWDTRQVVYSEFTPFKDYAHYRMFCSDFYKRRYSTAIDNGAKLNWGSCKKLKPIDESFTK